MKFNYSKICSEMVSGLPQRQKEVILGRFGLGGGERETLEAIGEKYDITRERVRQIQEDAISRIKPKMGDYPAVFNHFSTQFDRCGSVKREDQLLDLLGGEKFQNHVLFLLTLAEPFSRFAETDHLHPFWTTDPKILNAVSKKITSFAGFLSKKKEPVMLENISVSQIFGKEAEKEKMNRISLEAFQSFLEVSKKVQKNKDGFFGLKEWPEINPKGIKDKAYLAFKKEQKPLHFNTVAKLIGDKSNPQSVHNELIKDPRFILVGRGSYALKEWGYEPGVVRDVIVAVLKKSKNPLAKEEILERVKQQRLVKENTILLNLNNRRYFSKNPAGKYTLANKRA